jgi:hypothetical protein
MTALSLRAQGAFDVCSAVLTERIKIIIISTSTESRGAQRMANPRFEAVSREHIIRAARKIDPKGIQKWSVLVERTEYPVKQLLMEACNLIESSAPRVTPADFIAHSAVRKLKKLGFTVKYYEDGA